MRMGCLSNLKVIEGRGDPCPYCNMELHEWYTCPRIQSVTMADDGSITIDFWDPEKWMVIHPALLKKRDDNPPSDP